MSVIRRVATGVVATVGLGFLGTLAAPAASAEEPVVCLNLTTHRASNCDGVGLLGLGSLLAGESGACAAKVKWDIGGVAAPVPLATDIAQIENSMARGADVRISVPPGAQTCSPTQELSTGMGPVDGLLSILDLGGLLGLR